MLTQEGCLKRRSRLWSSLPDSVEWVLISNPRHVKYFSNIWVNPISFSAGQSVWLHMERSGKVIALADNFTLKSLSGEAYVDETISEAWYDGKNSVDNRDYKQATALKKHFGSLTLSNGAIECDSLPVATFETITGEPEVKIKLGDVIKFLRRQKEADEIAHLRTCMEACEAGHQAALNFVRPGATEMEVYRNVHAAVLEQAGRPCLVYGDFRATNANLPKAGGLPIDYTLQEGDLYILDYSVILDGYRSDFTNTIAVGEPSDDQCALMNACIASLEAGEKALKAEVACKTIFDICSETMIQKGFEALPSHAGHGLGLEHPEPPAIVSNSTDTLLIGDVVTLEPGNYIQGIGGVRIERNYLITQSGSENLSHHKIALQ
ncbi:MAG: Xaa-Pro peptidase family protein [Verrucomicrobia bacterium]|nr:Xaa-Pro peptidase family protein [Verrucomicrobiota bacterium]MDA1067912.1 Xaa-Pro peptidase family protein [Verrucomicrobiota bacterium]